MESAMARYGISTVGGVPFTGYTNTLGYGAANGEATSGYVAMNGISQGDDRIAKMLRNGGMTYAVFQLMYSLLGAAPGAAALKQKRQVQHVQGSPGGAIPIEV